jgi:hypothetical protein
MGHQSVTAQVVEADLATLHSLSNYFVCRQYGEVCARRADPACRMRGQAGAASTFADRELGRISAREVYRCSSMNPCIDTGA